MMDVNYMLIGLVVMLLGFALYFKIVDKKENHRHDK